MSNLFGWHYPPGVSGNEPEIAGYPPCYRQSCGHDAQEHVKWMASGSEVQPPEGTDCVICNCQEYQEYPDEPDPDEAYDRKREFDRL